ncbi:WD40-like repeat protein [Rubellimicrobium thermophilum DSM 16684]|uniref:WD40-like repeat protein n=1 Tax=Rubellimicrobium thermophilum DSM 16684 TaxID=1123069 RepID=S9R5L7_9RHOB|nr:PQQ-binding-like beta-propeller repeat protein [Rubellimicrobium thermophilum]EPX87197.1 WD40-like repeat protein [Rubellimicrobium thermophilum DSM 16684]
MTGRRLGIAVLGLAALAACGQQEVILPGERLPLREGTFANTTPLAQPRGIALPAQTANADWTHRNGGPSHAAGHPALPGNLALAFSVPIGEGNSRRARITAEPVIAGGRVFTLDARATVSAFSTGGGLLWSREVVPAGVARADASGGGLATDGDVLIVTTGHGQVTALDAATGETRWTQDLDAPGTAAPTILGDLVIVMARDGQAWALERGNGRVRWTQRAIPSEAGYAGGAGAAARPGLVILPYASGEVAAVFPEGGLRRWSTVIAGRRLGAAAAHAATDIGADPVIDGGRVYVGNVSGTVAALDIETGRTLWTLREGAVSPVWPAGDSIFLVNDLNELLRIEAATGAVIWRQPLPRAERRRGVSTHLGPVLAGGRLILAATDGALRQYDPASGTPLGDIPLPAEAVSAPVVAGQTLYVVTGDGRLNAFR